MQKVTGIGGIFFRSRDPNALRTWYVEHLGLAEDGTETVVLRWREADDPERPGSTVWSPFPPDTTYFGSAEQAWMVNFRVGDLDAMLDQLRRAGAAVDARVEESEFGRFGWFEDPEGNRVELWQPPEGM